VIFWNDGKGHFSQTTPVGPPNSAARAAAAGDLNGDGRPDLVVGGERQGLFVYLNRGKREFSDPIMLVGKQRVPYSVAIADLNRDGKPDIVVGNLGAPGSVFFNDGTWESILARSGRISPIRLPKQQRKPGGISATSPKRVS